jgi:hypothetical protein
LLINQGKVSDAFYKSNYHGRILTLLEC